MSAIEMTIPDEVMTAMRESPELLAGEVRLAAAVKLYELGKLSSGIAAQLAGLSRVEFLTRIGQYQVSPFPTSEAEIRRDIERV